MASPRTRTDPATVKPGQLFRCRVCQQHKPADLMGLDHGQIGTRCKACRAAQEKAARARRKAQEGYRDPGVYPCPSCELYVQCARNPVPCARFRAYVRGEL
jgi:hypothetical protein